MAAVSPTLPAVCQLEEGKERRQRWGRGALACAPPTPTPKPRALGAGEGGRCVSLGDPRRPVASDGGSTLGNATWNFGQVPSPSGSVTVGLCVAPRREWRDTGMSGKRWLLRVKPGREV